MRPPRRFVVYADFLGTTQRYKDPSLIRRGRELLEQALAQCVVPHLSANDMNLYVFSDTAIITSPQLDPLLAPISRLFSHFIELLGEGEDMSLELWMRAAISVGSVIHVDHLKNSERIRTIPFLDTSLPTVYKLEGLRKGSRVFIDPAIRDHAFEERKNTFFRWQQITGHGEFIANVTEFLWPAIAYSDEGRLARITQKLHHWWSESLNAKEWPKPEYFERMLHLDETVKLFIRASSLFCFGNCKTNLLFSFLPKHKGRRRNLTYQWGLWFQAMR